MENKFERNEFGDVIDYRFEFINGDKRMYKDVERGPFVGYTIILKRPHSSTMINLKDQDEAWDTINSHIEKYEDYVKQDESLANYLTSEEGKWGRQDGYGRGL